MTVVRPSRRPLSRAPQDEPILFVASTISPQPEERPKGASRRPQPSRSRLPRKKIGDRRVGGGILHHEEVAAFEEAQGGAGDLPAHRLLRLGLGDTVVFSGEQ